MSTREESSDLTDLNARVQAIWDQNAGFWDDHMGPEGNHFHRLLVSPPAERLLAIQAGEVVLEIACGAGVFARRLADLGAQVLATDFSQAFLDRARHRSRAYADRIQFRLLDAMDEAQLRALGEHRFDAVATNMALMDMADIRPLAAALPHLLKPSGRFVLTIMHPCFNTSGCALMAEQEDNDRRVEVTYAIKVKRYLGLSVDRGLGILGQPAPQYYFHRPLHRLLGPFLQAGLILDGIEEPAFDATMESRRQTSWGGNYHEIPPVLALRLRPR